MSNKEKMIEKLGGEDAYLEYMRGIGRKGGQLSKSPPDHPTRFDNNKELAIRAGKTKRKK